MGRYVALLRAINVGGHTVKMEALRRLFAEMGFTDASTFIASGNVVFSSVARDPAALEKKIARHLEKALGYEVATFVRSVDEVAAVADHDPFGNAAEDESLYIAFLPAAPAADARARLMQHRSEVDDFHVHGREVYWRCRGRMSDSAFSGALLEKAVGMPATLRNATTVRKLAALHAATK